MADEPIDQVATSDDIDEALVALTPAELPAVQTRLIGWCDRKIAAVNAELHDLEEHLVIARTHGWKLRALEASINRSTKRILYYEKIQSALRAGYLIVPNMPVSVFAVRVQRKRPREEEKTTAWGRFEARPELLPAGEGRYVDESLSQRNLSYDEEQPDGSVKHVGLYRSGKYDEEVDFPFPLQMTKPVVLEATSRALALKLFDQLGTVQNAVGRDPIVVGQLLDPRGRGRCCTFFVAWWLDTRTL